MEKLIEELDLNSASSPISAPFEAPDVGQFMAVFESSEGAKTATTFWVGGSGESAWSMERPDRLALTMEKSAYQPGDMAKIMVRAPFAGKLLISVERDPLSRG